MDDRLKARDLPWDGRNMRSERGALLQLERSRPALHGAVPARNGIESVTKPAEARLRGEEEEKKEVLSLDDHPLKAGGRRRCRLIPAGRQCGVA